METSGNPGSTHASRWAALGVLLAGALLDILDGQIVVVALPTIQRELHLDSASLLWTTAGYFLAMALALVAGGRWGDHFGRRRLFLIGVAGFGLASLVAGLAPSAAVLVSARVVQGFVGALMIPQVMTFIQVGFPAEERGQAFGMYGMVYALGGLLGPVAGGFLAQWNLWEGGWRTIFLVNVPVSVVLLLLARRWMAESRADQVRRVDGGGTVILALALAALLVPLIQGPGLGWPWWTLALLAAAPFLAWGLALYERWFDRKTGAALVPPSVLKTPGVAAGLSVSLLLFTVLGAPFLLSLHLQNTLGLGSLTTGLFFLPTVVGVVAGSMGAGALVNTWGRKVVFAGLGLLAAALGWLAWAVTFFGSQFGFWTLLPGLLVLGVGSSSVPIALTALTLGRVQPQHAGTASGLMATVGQVGGALCMALAGLGYFQGQAAGLSEPLAVTVVLGASAVMALGTWTLVGRLPARPGQGAS